MRTSPARRAVLIGLDCASPRLLFGELAQVMPNLTALRARGRFGTLRSTTPPITVPAWACMLTGRDPGELGLYGFRERVAGGYGMRIASSEHVHAAWVWELAARAGKRGAALFVPPSYPPRAHADVVVSCMLTPDAGSVHTHPPELGAQLAARFGAYKPDVEGFRDRSPYDVLAELRELSAQHFAIARHVQRTRKPDLLAMVDIATDRLHHVLWRSLDARDPRHDPDPALRRAALDYLALLDRELGALLAQLDESTSVLVVSDHGARPLHGAIAINEWLIDQGYLVVRGLAGDARSRRDALRGEVTPLAALDVDWARTRAWAEGGYYARVFLNVQGREPLGAIPPERVASERDELQRRLASIPGPSGEALQHRIERPEALYRAQRGVPPDLLVFFGDLDYRAAGTLGHGGIHLAGNDTGADACNHDWDGLFVLAGPSTSARAQPEAWSLYDVTRTLLGLLGVGCDDELLGVDRTA